MKEEPYFYTGKSENDSYALFHNYGGNMSREADSEIGIVLSDYVPKCHKSLYLDLMKYRFGTVHEIVYEMIEETAVPDI